MTPQEADLVNALFDRLGKLEAAPRDPAAERVIADGLRHAPNAVYALVQTALVQDEALRRANARIEELQAQTGGASEAEQRPSSFLDAMREAFTGRAPAPARGSVPSVRPPVPGSQPPSPQSQSSQPQGSQQPPGYPPPYAGSGLFGSGGSFLGTAASAAAGVIGGALLLDGIRSMFGHHYFGYGSGSTFGGFGDNWSSPWNNNIGGGTDSDLGRELGVDQIGHQNHDAGNDQQSNIDSFGTADELYNADDQNDAGGGDFDAGGGDFGGGGSYDV